MARCVSMSESGNNEKWSTGRMNQLLHGGSGQGPSDQSATVTSDHNELGCLGCATQLMFGCRTEAMQVHVDRRMVLCGRLCART